MGRFISNSPIVKCCFVAIVLAVALCPDPLHLSIAMTAVHLWLARADSI
jgi:hypothetical protein